MNQRIVENKPKIAFFSDSRGWHKADPSMRFFWENLNDEYKVVSYSQPFKWTTILDFISLVRDGIIVPTDYDHIVLWSGIVDFSPRPLSSSHNDLLAGHNSNQVTINRNRKSFYNRRVNEKASTINRILVNRFIDGNDAQGNIKEVSPEIHDVYYAGELTASLYSKSFLSKIAEELNAIENLIFIDCCRIHPHWDGNFKKGRPRNIDVTSSYSAELSSQLTCPVISISDWSYDEIQKFTIDSIHVTQQGSDRIESSLRSCFSEIRKTPLASTGNYVISASDSNFFASVLLLIESVFEMSSGSVDGIIVFDVGLTVEQRRFLESIKNVYVVEYFSEDRPELLSLPFDFFDPETYGFKAYLTVKAPQLIERATGAKGPFNLMYIDAGIVLNNSISHIFSTIEEDGIFCVDHDECHDLYGDSPFFLLNILSPKLFDEGFEVLSYEKLCKPYIKAGFFGYQSGGKFQYLLDEYWNLCLTTSVLSLPKPVSDRAEKMWYRNNTKVARYARENIGSDIPAKCFEYSNGRQDQTALSYLISKHDVNIRNSRDHNFTVSTNVEKSQVLKIIDRLKQKYPEIPADSEIFFKEANEKSNRLTKASLLPIPNIARNSDTILHRGALAEKDNIKFAGRLLNRARNIRNDTFILLGNGPSLADVDFFSLRQYHTMGLNAAYRAYERMGFWPKYFGCFDALVCGYHADNFKKLVRNSEIEKFFFINYNEQKKPIFPEEDIQTSSRFQPINFVERTVPEKDRDDILSVSFNPFIDMLTSGSNSVQTALLLGYRKIILLGCDANYTEVIDGAAQEKSNKNRIVMERTPEKNTNYWFDDYQQEGDRFNLPNTAGCQLPAWGRLARSIRLLNVNAEVINCSPISKIDDFKKMPLDDALKYFDSYDCQQTEATNRRNRFRRKLVKEQRPSIDDSMLSSAPAIPTVSKSSAALQDSLQFVSQAHAGPFTHSLALYPSPLSLTAQLLEQGATPEHALSECRDAVAGWLDTGRKNRGKITLVELPAFAANPDAYATALKDLGFDTAEVPVADAAQPDAVMLAVAASVLQQDAALMRDLGELQASTLVPEGVTPPGVANPADAVQQTKAQAARLADLKSALTEKETLITQHNTRIAQQQQQIEQLRASAERQGEQARDAMQSVRKLTAEVTNLKEELAAVSHDRDRIYTELTQVYRSTSWRVSKPVRGLGRLLKGDKSKVDGKRHV